MKIIKTTVFKAIAASVLLHVIAALICLVVRWSTRPLRPVEIYLQLPQPETTTETPEVIPPPVRQIDSVPLADKVRELLAEIPPDELVTLPEVAPLDTTKADAPAKFDRTSFFARAPQLAFQHPLENTTSDSSDTIRVLPLTGAPPFANYADSQLFKVTPGPFDRLQQDIDKRNTGATPSLPLTTAVREGAKYLSDLFDKNKKDKPVRLDFVPSMAELDVLKTLWENSKATDQEVYAALDTSIRLTAEDMNKVLERLTEKGLLTRELVSPQNELMLPIGAVEMSAKNRRNRVYEYRSRISAGEVLRYLQAVTFEAEFGGKTTVDSTRKKYIAGLKEKIARLMEIKG